MKNQNLENQTSNNQVAFYNNPSEDVENYEYHVYSENNDGEILISKYFNTYEEAEKYFNTITAKTFTSVEQSEYHEVYINEVSREDEYDGKELISKTINPLESESDDETNFLTEELERRDVDVLNIPSKFPDLYYYQVHCDGRYEEALIRERFETFAEAAEYFATINVQTFIELEDEEEGYEWHWVYIYEIDRDDPLYPTEIIRDCIEPLKR